MMSSTFKIILHTCVARNICCFLLLSVSKTFCSFMSLVPTSLQSMPRWGLPSLSCRALTSVKLWMGSRPEFSARARGTLSSASAGSKHDLSCCQDT